MSSNASPDVGGALQQLRSLVGEVEASELFEDEGADLVLFDDLTKGEGIVRNASAAAAASAKKVSTKTDQLSHSDDPTISDAVARAFAYLHSVSGQEVAASFLQMLAVEREFIDAQHGIREEATMQNVENAYQSALFAAKPPQEAKGGKKKKKGKAVEAVERTIPENLLPFEEAIVAGSAWDTASRLGWSLLQAKGLSHLPLPMMFINGRPSHGEDVETHLFEGLQEELKFLQQVIQSGLLNDRIKSPYDALLDGDLGAAIFEQFHPIIFADETDEDGGRIKVPNAPKTDSESEDTSEEGPDTTKLQFVALSKYVHPPNEYEDGLPLPPPYMSDHSPTVGRLAYFHRPESGDEVKTITHWVVADFATVAGRQLLSGALEWLLQDKCRSRMAFIPVRSALASAPSALDEIVSRAILVTSTSLPPTLEADMFTPVKRPDWGSSHSERVISFLRALLPLHHLVISTASAGRSLTSSLTPEDAYRRAIVRLAHKSKLEAGLVEVLEREVGKQSGPSAAVLTALDDIRTLFAVGLQLSTESPIIIANGRVLLLTKGATFKASDFLVLETYEEQKRAGPIRSVIDLLQYNDIGPDDLTRSDRRKLSYHRRRRNRDRARQSFEASSRIPFDPTQAVSHARTYPRSS